VLKIILIVFFLFVIVVVGLLTYVKTSLPDVGDAPHFKVEIRPERVSCREYIANSVAVCMDCHSTRKWTKFSWALVEGTLGMGGEIFDRKFGFPGTYISKNITPFGVGDWTDGELFRAITSGVDKDGNALFPLMPHPSYGQISEEDVASIIPSIRTLDPIENNPGESESDFPMNFIINTIPKPPSFNNIPARGDREEYGKYLTVMAACADCHTVQVKGKKVEGMVMAGGFEFPLPTGGIVRSQNLTPHIETGIGNWTEEAFVARFKVYADTNYVPPTVKKGEFNSAMP